MTPLFSLHTLNGLKAYVKSFKKGCHFILYNTYEFAKQMIIIVTFTLFYITTAVPVHVTINMPPSCPSVLYCTDTPITALAPIF